MHAVHTCCALLQYIYMYIYMSNMQIYNHITHTYMHIHAHLCMPFTSSLLFCSVLIISREDPRALKQTLRTAAGCTYDCIVCMCVCLYIVFLDHLERGSKGPETDLAHCSRMHIRLYCMYVYMCMYVCLYIVFFDHLDSESKGPEARVCICVFMHVSCGCMPVCMYVCI